MDRVEKANRSKAGVLRILLKALDHRGNTLYDEDVAPALQLPTHPSG